MSFHRPELKVSAALKVPKLAATAGSPRARTCLDGAIVRPIFTRSELINAESELGRSLFGPIPSGRQREFFELEENVWIWHESWQENGLPKETTLRYEVRPSGVYKKLQGSEKNYVLLEGKELENFCHALHAYLDLVKSKLY